MMLAFRGALSLSHKVTLAQVADWCLGGRLIRPHSWPSAEKRQPSRPIGAAFVAQCGETPVQPPNRSCIRGFMMAGLCLWLPRSIGSSRTVTHLHKTAEDNDSGESAREKLL
jgi:hypothetical protein